MSVFYDRLLILCAKRGVSPSRAAQDIGLSNAAASGWAGGKVPRDTTIVKFANYFNVSPGYMRGEEQKENPTSPKADEVDGAVAQELYDMVHAATEEERLDMLEILRIYKGKKRRKDE